MPYAFPTAPLGIFMEDGNKPSPHGYGINEGDPLADGLCGYWPLWEAAGLTSGNFAENTSAPPATTVGTSWSRGPNGTAIDFGGGTDQFRIENPFTLLLDMAGATEGTWAVWVNVRSVDAEDVRLIDHHGATGANSWGWAFGIEGDGAGFSGTELALYVNATVGNWNMVSPANVIIPAEWHLYTVTWRGGDFCKFFRDGEFVAASATGVAAGPIATVAGTAAQRKIVLGTRVDDFDRELDGIMGEAAIWNRVLGDAEIESLFNEQFRIITPESFTPTFVEAAVTGNPWYQYANQQALVG